MKQKEELERALRIVQELLTQQNLKPIVVRNARTWQDLLNNTLEIYDTLPLLKTMVFTKLLKKTVRWAKLDIKKHKDRTKLYYLEWLLK